MQLTETGIDKAVTATNLQPWQMTQQLQPCQTMQQPADYLSNHRLQHNHLRAVRLTVLKAVYDRQNAHDQQHFSISTGER
jgi:hypothetical protein